MEIALRGAESGTEGLKMIRSLVDLYPGECPLYLRISLDEAQTLIETGITIKPDTALITTLEGMVGQGGVTVI